jgi:hypothetical protein
MRLLHLWGSIAGILCCICANCQTPPINQHPLEKPLLFQQFQEKINCPLAVLQQIFSATPDSNINLSLGTQAKIEGTVIAKVAVTPEQISINIRCNNFQRALLNVSRITKADGSFSYIGRIVSLQHGDVLLLWEENGQYYFIRDKQLLTMVE